MLKPRNTLVTVVEIKDAETKTESGLVIPHDTSREYRLCHVVDVGPGMLTHKDEISPCVDLKRGQTVLVKVGNMRRVAADQAMIEPLGVKYKDDAGRDLKLVDQSMIVAIVEPSAKTPRLVN